MKDLKNQIGHHVVIEKNSAGEVTKISDVKVLSASEYLVARDSYEQYKAKVLELEQKEALEQREEQERLIAQRKQEEAETAYKRHYSRTNFIIAWLVAKVLSLEGKIKTPNEVLEELYDKLESMPIEELVHCSSEIEKIFKKITEVE